VAADIASGYALWPEREFLDRTATEHLNALVVFAYQSGLAD
jgi:hypothetical protein